MRCELGQGFKEEKDSLARNWGLVVEAGHLLPGLNTELLIQSADLILGAS